RYRINAKSLDKTLSIPAPEVYDVYNTVCRDLGIKKAPPLYMGRADVSPMVYGFFRSKIVLPSAEMSAQTVTYILRHELIHYKRRDLWLKLIAMLANAIHWFNPLVYIACGMLANETELSCDEKALGGTDLMQRLNYGNSMLEIVKLCRHSPKLTTGFSPKKRAVRERFENMINTTKKKKGYWIVAITLICALLCTSIIGCATKDTEPKDSDETGEPATQEYDAVGWIENIEGEEQYDWYLRVEDDIMTLGHTAEDGSTDLCYRYGDASKHDDVIDLKSILHMTEDNQYDYMLRGWISESYALIEYDTPIESVEDCENFRFVTIDLSDGSVTNEICYEVDDILSLHGLDREVLSVYESWGGNPPEYKIKDYVNRYEMSGEPPSNKMYISLTLENKDIRRAGIEVYFDMETGELSEPQKGHCNLEKYTSNDLVTDIADISKIEGIDENTVKAAKAFLSGDTTTLERLGGYEPGFLKDLKSIKFCDYRISKLINDKGLQLEAYVTETLAYNVDKGFHTFGITDSGVGHSCVGCLASEIENYYPAMAEKMAENWVIFSNSPVVPMGDAYTEESFYDVVRYIHFIYNANTVDEYRSYAEKCFGIKILTDIYTDEEAEEKKMELWNIYCDDKYAYDGIVVTDIVDAGENFITLQFYADGGSFIPAYQVKYEFIEENGEFYFKNSTVLNDTGREAYRAKPIHGEDIIYAEISE
ncbi:MAG: M56 family metallopeptidase, partial [Clostridia bacterium]|nr:M56 family metallopeptidase [Clostridia bacterium]